MLFCLLVSNFRRLGAVDIKLTEEEKKELEAPYLPQAAFGHA